MPEVESESMQASYHRPTCGLEGDGTRSLNNSKSPVRVFMRSASFPISLALREMRTAGAAYSRTFTVSRTATSRFPNSCHQRLCMHSFLRRVNLSNRFINTAKALASPSSKRCFPTDLMRFSISGVRMRGMSARPCCLVRSSKNSAKRCAAHSSRAHSTTTRPSASSTGGSTLLVRSGSIVLTFEAFGLFLLDTPRPSLDEAAEASGSAGRGNNPPVSGP